MNWKLLMSLETLKLDTSNTTRKHERNKTTRNKTLSTITWPPCSRSKNSLHDEVDIYGEYSDFAADDTQYLTITHNQLSSMSIVDQII